MTEEIARLRHTQPGVALISPPPHHDIYSIEDLAQLIFDLSQVNPEAAISVKLVSETGVGLVAAGVREGARRRGPRRRRDGGTGASPLTSIKNAGAPVGARPRRDPAGARRERPARARSAAGRRRLQDGPRRRRRRAARRRRGHLRHGPAARRGLPDGALLPLDTCPVGIATQRPELRAKFAGTPEQVDGLPPATSPRRCGGCSPRSASARSTRRSAASTCSASARTGDPRADALDLAPLLGSAGDGPAALRRASPCPSTAGWELGERARRGCVRRRSDESAARRARLRDHERRTAPSARALGGVIGQRTSARSRRPGASAPRFEGVGRSELRRLSRRRRRARPRRRGERLRRERHGRRPHRDRAAAAATPAIRCSLGNTVLYGATGGELYCAGAPASASAVRNSGAVAVVEGAGDHACEYMTQGTVVVLGRRPQPRRGHDGRRGLRARPRGAARAHLNPQLVAADPVARADAERLRTLVERHLRYTGSRRARELLDDWAGALAVFRRVSPHADVARLQRSCEGSRQKSA